MDLAQLDTTIRAEEGVEMILRHPTTNEELDVVLTVRGVDSKAMKAAFAKFRRVMDDERKSDNEKDKATADLVVRCIVDIHGAEYNGKPIESTDEGKRFFVEHFQWAATQVFEFISELDHFLPPSVSV